MKARFKSILILAIFVVILIAGIWALPVLVDRTYAAIKEAEEAARIAALPTPHPLEGIFDNEAAKTLGFETMAKGEYADYYFTLNSMDSRFIFIEAAEAMLRYMTDELGMEFIRPEFCVYNNEETNSFPQFSNEIHCDVSDISSCWFSFSALFEGDVPGWYPVALYSYLMADKSGAMTAEDAQKWYEENKEALPPLSDYWLVPDFFPESFTAFEALMSITAEKFENGLRTYEEIAEAIGFSEDEETVRLSRPGEFCITSDKLIIICDTVVQDFNYAKLRIGMDNIRSQMDLVLEFLKPMVTEGFWMYEKSFTELPAATFTMLSDYMNQSITSYSYTLPFDTDYLAHYYAMDVIYNNWKITDQMSELYIYGIQYYLDMLARDSKGYDYDVTYYGSDEADPYYNRLYEVYKIVCELDGLDPVFNNERAMLKAEAIQYLYERGINISRTNFLVKDFGHYSSSSAYADFVRYIHETYGIDSVFNLTKSTANPDRIVGRTMLELVSDWKADLDYDEVISVLEERKPPAYETDETEETGETDETGEESDGD